MNQHDSILAALAELKLELTTLISTGLAAIKDEHSRALLEQAKMNATFASRDALDTLRSQTDRNTAEIVALHKFAHASTEDRAKIHARLDETTTSTPKRTIANYDRWVGYAVAGTFTLFGGLAVILLTHHP